MREQKARIFDDARKPFFLQTAWRDVLQQFGDFPDLYELVGQARIAARDFLGHHGEGLYLGLRIDWRAAEFFGDAQCAHANLVRAFE